jgi:hypothetical protein
MSTYPSFFFSFALVLFSSPALAADHVPARDAAKLHRAGDTAAAIAIWQALASKGDVNAAFNLGTIHQHGDGAARNPTEAMRWYLHHDHHPEMQAWRQQAAELIAVRDMRENLLASRRNSDQVMADLRRRAGMSIATQDAPQFASGQLPAAN